jgi:hypothetical protein
VNRGGSPAKYVKSDVKPAVNIIVNLEVSVAKLPWAYALLGGPCFGCGTVFVGTAHIQGLVAAKSAEAGKNIGRKHLDKISQMGNVVYIRESGRNKFTFHGVVMIIKRKGSNKGVIFKT